MPALVRTIGVRRRYPAAISMVSLKTVSKFFECVLRHHTGVAYLAVLRGPLYRMLWYEHHTHMMN